MKFHVEGELVVFVPKDAVESVRSRLVGRVRELMQDSAFFSEVESVEDAENMLGTYAVIKAVSDVLWERYRLDWDVDTESYENGLFYGADLRSHSGWVTEYDISEEGRYVKVRISLVINNPYYAVFYSEHFSRLVNDMARGNPVFMKERNHEG